MMKFLTLVALLCVGLAFSSALTGEEELENKLLELLLKRVATNEKRNESTGTVRWFNSDKGYGFITPDGGGNDLPVHHSEIQGGVYATLDAGQRVTYEVGQSQKGPFAKHVVVL